MEIEEGTMWEEEEDQQEGGEGKESVMVWIWLYSCIFMSENVIMKLIILYNQKDT
jgi:hypothetical protein